MNNAVMHYLHKLLVLKWKDCTSELLTEASSKKIDGFSFCLCLDGKITVKKPTVLNLCFFPEWLWGLVGIQNSLPATKHILPCGCRGGMMWTASLFSNLSWIQIIQKDLFFRDSSLCWCSEWSLGVRHKVLVWDRRLLLELVVFSCRETNKLHEWEFKQNRKFCEQFKSRSKE